MTRTTVNALLKGTTGAFLVFYYLYIYIVDAQIKKITKEQKLNKWG